MKKNTVKNLVKSAKTQTTTNTKEENNTMKTAKTTEKKQVKKEVKAPELEKKELKITIKGGAIPSDLKLSKDKQVTNEERQQKTTKTEKAFIEWYRNACEKDYADQCFMRADGKGKIFALPFREQKREENGITITGPFEAAAIAASHIEYDGMDNKSAYEKTCKELGISHFTAWQVIQANYTGAAALLNKLQILSRELSLLRTHQWKDTEKGTGKERFEEEEKAVWSSVARKVSQDYCNGGDAGLKVLKRAWASKAYITGGKPGTDEKTSK